MTLLRVYTEYSMLEGECRLEELAKTASALGYSACAKTDKGTLAGCLEFSEHAKKYGINPLTGCEINTFVKGEQVTLILLANNSDGIYDLNVFSSYAMTEKNGLVPCGIFSKYSANVTAIAVGFDAVYEKHKNNDGKAKAVLDALKDSFESFYVGLERTPDESEERSFKLYNFCRKNSVKCVATPPVYLTKKENAEISEILSYIKNGSTTEGKEKSKYYIRSVQELKDLFSHLDYVWENTCRLGRMCKAEFETDMLYMPVYPHVDSAGLLIQKAKDGLAQKGLSQNEEYVKRLKKELDVIETMGFADYFLITVDFVSFAKKSGIPVGPGRGSGVGSLTAYCIGITAVDPVANGLLFERFLNEERVTLPDFDVDFGDARREEIINYVKEKYGRKHVCGIANYSRFAFRQCIRDVAKYTGIDSDEVTKYIPEKTGITVKEALESSAELQALYTVNEKIARAIDLCRLLEGRPKAVSPHPSGVIMTERPVSHHAPLMKLYARADGVCEMITQYSMDTCAKLGLLKIDFLGIKYLTVIDMAKKLIEKRYGSIYNGQPPMDNRVFEMLSQGHSAGVFQLEGGQMKELLKKMKPESLDDLTALISLYRPGPKIYIEQYLKGRNNPKEVKYPVPQAESVLKSTYGCPIYQEQIMQLCKTLAGFSLGHADVVRRYMAKKDVSKMNGERKAFVDGCVQNGIDKSIASKLFDEIAGFAGYAFNKSHAVAYATLAYETAYLKCLYPKEYFSARLEAVQGQFNKVCEYADEIASSGVRLLAPDVNISTSHFEPVDEGILYSLSAIKGVGVAVAEKIVKEREKNGSFSSLDDFISRTGAFMGTFSAVALAKSGALDCFGEKRSIAVSLCEKYVSQGFSPSSSDEQMTLSFDTDTEMKYERPLVSEYTQSEKSDLEKEFTGISFIDFKAEAKTTPKSFALYIRINKESEPRLSSLTRLFEESNVFPDGIYAVIRIFDEESGKVSQLKNGSVYITNSVLEKAEALMGKGNVKLKELKQ